VSTAAAIATTTATLQQLLEQSTSANSVTTLPPGIARDPNNNSSQLNVFLYKTDIDTAFSNAPLPGSSRPNESAHPPLALSLRYLVTCYGADDNDISGQQVIGEAMLALHDHAVLSRDLINGIVPDSGLHDQLERVRITASPMTVDELIKLWTVFQTDYRLSQAYEVSVALIESERPAVTPLPVLRRGAADRGVELQTDALPPFPCIENVEFANQNIEAVAGESVIFRGHHLDATNAVIRFNNQRLDDFVDVAAAANTASSITVQIPVPPTGFVSGVYIVQAVLTDGPVTRLSNAIGMSIAPEISNLVVGGGVNNRTLTIDLTPDVADGQQVSLLLGGQQFTGFTQPAPGQVEFALGTVTAGNYLVRLRVDGVDSRLIDRTAEPPEFLVGAQVVFP